MQIKIDCFKAYDIRGRVPDQLNADIAYRIGQATASFLDAKSVVVGRDMRLSSEELADAITRGLTDAGVNVIDIGLCGTEMVYFATAHLGADGGIMVTASHNPADHNGLKLVREKARPISADSGLKEIQALAESGYKKVPAKQGRRTTENVMDQYIDLVLGFVDARHFSPLKIVVNPGNGGAGLVIDELEGRLPFEMIKIHYEADGTFPNGVPNPLLVENRQPTVDAIRDNGADLGIAWDGDFDRCFFFDENGRFIEGYYLVGLLAENLLQRSPGSNIVHDPRLVWNTSDVVESAGGHTVQSKAGHSFIKETMRKHDAVYGGEMSAHHYFRDFFYADSGMIPWLLVAELMCLKKQKLSQLVDERIVKFPASGEINREVADSKKTLGALHDFFGGDALSIDKTDGYSFEFPEWRFNIRQSNTEPVVRINVESRADEALMREKTEQILGIVAAN